MAFNLDAFQRRQERQLEKRIVKALKEDSKVLERRLAAYDETLRVKDVFDAAQWIGGHSDTITHMPVLLRTKIDDIEKEVKQKLIAVTERKKGLQEKLQLEIVQNTHPDNPFILIPVKEGYSHPMVDALYSAVYNTIPVTQNTQKRQRSIYGFKAVTSGNISGLTADNLAYMILAQMRSDAGSELTKANIEVKVIPVSYRMSRQANGGRKPAGEASSGEAAEMQMRMKHVQRAEQKAPEGMIDSKEAAEMLGYKSAMSLLGSAVARGNLKVAEKVGRRVYFKIEDVNALMAKRQTPIPAPAQDAATARPSGEYITAAKAAEELRLTKEGVYRLRSLGRIQGEKRGNGPTAPLYIKEDSIISFMEAYRFTGKKWIKR